MGEDYLGDLREKLAVNDVEHKSFKHRLDELEQAGRERTDILLRLQEQNTTLKNLGESVKTLADGVGKIDERVKAIEREPADKYKEVAKKITELIVAAIVGGVIAYIAGKGL